VVVDVCARAGTNGSDTKNASIGHLFQMRFILSFLAETGTHTDNLALVGLPFVVTALDLLILDARPAGDLAASGTVDLLL
jgi:hypothetical protein